MQIALNRQNITKYLRIILMTFFLKTPILFNFGCAHSKKQKSDNKLTHSNPPNAASNSEDRPKLPPPEKPISAPKQQETDIQRGLNLKEVVLGMSMDDVIAVWGQPKNIEIAGEDRLGNQKWIYFDGYPKASLFPIYRLVYFETGKVVGWKNFVNIK